MPRRSASPRARRFLNDVYYLFGGDRMVNTHLIPGKAQKIWLRRGDLVRQRKGSLHVSLTPWGQYNKYVRKGFGRAWDALSPSYRARVIQIFVMANLENANFPEPLPPNVRKVPYNARTHAGLISFFEYFRDLHDSLRKRALENIHHPSPEVQDTAFNDVFRYRNLVRAANATIAAIKSGKVKW